MKKLILLLLLPLALFGQNRLKDKPEAVTFAGDDWLYLDSPTYGVRKFDPHKYILAANNLSDLSSVSTALNNLGASTVGKALFSAPTPTSSVKYPRFNLDGTISWLDATSFVAAIGAGTGSGGGTWGSITGTLSAQTDLQTALNLKIDGSRLVNGHPLSADVTVTKGDVGLGSVDNTSDAGKPISTATQTALNAKADAARLVNGHALTLDVTVTKADVGLSNVANSDTTNATNISSGTLDPSRLAAGSALQVYRRNAGNTGGEYFTLSGGGDMLASNNLSDLASKPTSRVNLGVGNVDNTSDVNKPVSTAQQTALNLKANAANAALTGTATYERLSPTVLNIGTVANAGTAAFTTGYSVAKVVFSGTTANITLPSTPPDGVYTLNGQSTSGSRLVITVPSLIRPEYDNDSAITTLAIPATSTGLFTAQFTALGGSFVKFSAVGDELTPNADQVQAAYVASDTGAANAYVIAPSPALTAYSTLTSFVFKAANANTGASTLNVNSLGVKTIKKAAGGVTTDLAANDILANQIVTVTYDGTNFQMVSTTGNVSSGGSSTLATNAQTGTSYTYVLGDKSKLVTFNNASAQAVTIPLNATVAFSAGPTDATIISNLQLGAGTVTITPASGATLNGLTTGITLVQNIPLQIIQTAANTWFSTSAPVTVSDTAFASSWNGVTTIPPSKNAVYDQLHITDTDDDGLPNILDAIAAAGFPYTNSSGVIGGSRTIAVGSSKLTVTNADGAAGNPTIDSALVVAPSYVALTDAATIASTCDPLKVSQNATVTLGGNRTLGTPTAIAAGMTGVLIVKQDATGSRTLALWSGSKVISGGSGAVTLTTAANGIDILTWVYDGTNTFWTIGKNFN